VNEFGVVIMLVRKIEQIIFTVFTVLVLSAPATANEKIELERLYELFNSELVNSGFVKASRMFEEDRVIDSLKVLKSADIDLIRPFYSRKYATSNEECYSHSSCRESDLIFLSVITLIDYEIISIGSKSGTTRKMGVSGTNGGTTKIKLVVFWLHENDNWKIDRLMKVPTSGNVKFE